jgi:hypothetical protein
MALYNNCIYYNNSVENTTSGSGMLPSTTDSSPPSAVQRDTLTCKNITCQEGFYCSGEDAITCIPSCHTWNQYPRATNIAIDFLVLTAACIGVVTGVGVLVVAGLRWKKCAFIKFTDKIYIIHYILSPTGQLLVKYVSPT